MCDVRSSQRELWAQLTSTHPLYVCKKKKKLKFSFIYSLCLSIYISTIHILYIHITYLLMCMILLPFLCHKHTHIIHYGDVQNYIFQIEKMFQKSFWSHHSEVHDTIIYVAICVMLKHTHSNNTPNSIPIYLTT